MPPVVLFVDNRDEDRETGQRVLEGAGYVVKLAHNVEDARVLLETGDVDVAVLDLRLENDDDGNDVSGALLAKEEAYRHIPKIILTGHGMGFRDFRDMLKPLVGELPPAVSCVGKGEGGQVLIAEVRRALEVWPQLKLSTAKVSDQIRRDHEDARKQARWSYAAGFVLSILGIAIIFAGITLAWTNRTAIGVVGTAAGIVMQITSYLLNRRVDQANARMDFYHKELLETYWLETIVAVCAHLPPEKRNKCIENAIDAAIGSWLEQRPDTSMEKDMRRRRRIRGQNIESEAKQ